MSVDSGTSKNCYKMSKIFIVSLILVIASAMAIRPPEPIRDCGPNAVWTECGTSCPATCDSIKNPEPTSCITVCRRGCVCVGGYIKKTASSVECILPKDCKK